MPPEEQDQLAQRDVERVTYLAAEARDASDPAFLHAIDHLDAARDHLLAASELLVGFRELELVGMSEQDLEDEVRGLALQSSLLADLLDGLIRDATGM